MGAFQPDIEAVDPDASTPPSQLRDGVDVLLEHETGLEPATPTLAREDEPEEDPPLTL